MNLKWGSSPQLESGQEDQPQACMAAREQCRVVLEDCLTVWDIDLVLWR